MIEVDSETSSEESGNGGKVKTNKSAWFKLFIFSYLDKLNYNFTYIAVIWVLYHDK